MLLLCMEMNQLVELQRKSDVLQSTTLLFLLLLLPIDRSTPSVRKASRKCCLLPSSTVADPGFGKGGFMHVHSSNHTPFDAHVHRCSNCRENASLFANYTSSKGGSMETAVGFVISYIHDFFPFSF